MTRRNDGWLADESGRTNARNSSFGRLQKRAFGGEDVATRPGTEDDDWWPKGPLPAGVDAAMKRFVSGLGGAAHLNLTFLLGGAGNGKSYAARALGKELGLGVLGVDSLARRTYATLRNGVHISLLNDATIAPSTDYPNRQSIALASDIEGWRIQSQEAPVSAFCCVNRGIIVDEIRALEDEGPASYQLARSILSWLATPTPGLFDSLGAKPLPAEEIENGEYYREVAFELDGRRICVSALSVDMCSLTQAEVSEGKSRAGSLFEQIVDRCRTDAEARPEDCPVRANVMQWTAPGATLNWETLAEFSEIASGRLYSYRDIWGLAALTILGPKFFVNDGTQTLLEHVDRCLDAMKSGNTPEQRLTAALELAQYRFANAIFGSATPGGIQANPRYPPATPAHFGLSLVDPSTWGGADSTQVEVGMQGIALGQYPSTVLKAKGLLSSGWSRFDQALEVSIVDFVNSPACTDIVRRRLISWLGGYLIRVVGVANGRLGNFAAVRAWKQCRDRCATGPAALPVELGQAIRSLVFPGHADAPLHSILVPAFAARVEPLQPSIDISTPRLAEVVSHASLNIRVRRLGSRLLLECVQAGTSAIVGQLLLDFALIREARACRGARAGQTESSAFVEPRIERCRASSLEAIPVENRSLIAISGGHRAELN